MNPIRALKKLELAPRQSPDKPIQTKTDYQSVAQVAKRLNCSKRHVDRLIDLGELQSVMDISLPNSRRQCLRIPRESVDDYLIRNSAQ